MIANNPVPSTPSPAEPTLGYWEKAFGCPASEDDVHWETFTCQPFIYQAVLNQGLINPVGKKFLFSELSFITLTYVIGTLARFASHSHSQ